MFKEYPCVMQEGPKDCGACSLLTIIKTYGGNVSLEYLRELTRTNKEGTNAYLIMNAAKEMGFTSKAVRGSVFDLDDDMFPCIAHVLVNKGLGHFIVIHKVDRLKKVLTIADPAVGRRLMSYNEFLEITTNQFILFTPTKRIPSYDNKNTLKETVMTLFKENKNIFISLFIFSLLCVIINIISSFNLQFIIDNVFAYNSINNLKFIFIIMLFLSLMKVINNYVRNSLLNYIEHELDHVLVQDIFKHIISLPYLYYKNRTTGEVISRINDLGEVRDVISKLFITVFVDFLLVIFVLFSLLSINIKLTLVTIGITFGYLFILFVFNPIIKRMVQKIKEDGAKVNSFMCEAISSIDTIKGLSLEEQIINKFYKVYNNFLNKSFSFNNLYNWESFFKELLDSIGLLIIIFVGSIFVLKDMMNLGELITFNSLIFYFLEPIKNVINFDVDIKKAKTSFDRVNDLYTIKKENLDFDEKYTNSEFKGNIKINNLSFSYDNKKEILHKITLNIKKGEKILITGNSGSGKSTFIRILLKYLEIDNSKIEIDNKDINYFNIRELREKISFVSQNDILYNDTLYNNVTINRYVDYDEFLNVCKMTKIEEIMDRNNLGSSLMIEENGFNLSGGERQRIMLGRALLKKAEIYIFDESLSQIDVSKERIILKEIFKKYKTKTFIVISHRSDNADLYDRKLELKDGKLID